MTIMTYSAFSGFECLASGTLADAYAAARLRSAPGPSTGSACPYGPHSGYHAG